MRALTAEPADLLWIGHACALCLSTEPALAGGASSYSYSGPSHAREARRRRARLGLTSSISGSPPSTHSCPLGGRPPSGPGVGDPMPWSGFWHDHFQSWMDWGPCSRRCGAGGPAAVDGAFARSASLPTGRCWCGEPRRRRAISYFSSYSWECAVAMDGAAADCGVWTACSSGKPVMRGAWAAAR